MYYITIEDIENGRFEIMPFLDEWYLDSAYKDLALLEGAKAIP